MRKCCGHDHPGEYCQQCPCLEYQPGQEEDDLEQARRRAPLSGPATAPKQTTEPVETFHGKPHRDPDPLRLTTVLIIMGVIGLILIGADVIWKFFHP